MNTRMFNYKDKSVMFINCSLKHCYNTADYMIKRDKNNGYWKPRLYDDYDQDHSSGDVGNFIEVGSSGAITIPNNTFSTGVESIYDWIEIKDSVTDLPPVTTDEIERAYNDLR